MDSGVRGRPPTAQAFVAGELRRAITSGELRPGAPIRQEALAARLDVSRVPLREALRMLEGEGLVEHRAHRGYVVAELSMDGLREVYRIRELLEAEALRVAADRLAEALPEAEEAQREVERAAAAGEVAAMAAANRRFHFALTDASGLPRLGRLIGSLWDATDAYRSLYYAEPGNRERVVAEHRAVLAALRAGDAEAAVRRLDHHRAGAVAALGAVLERP
ncbi:GntR family transcriptional regulator [Streptomyces sp. DSM 44917]|uniref:GntR family transcriptional regulator n=1 Tax=Streptomyces boetiae TaxID=3075541 RepID=A0ABU2LDB2_9ACTN|nr:GntR family transcriptional regulator [Streptomyces sp. DSM 44917]MDT0309569.1 GntR family transcriptional regulator [Streptomyces sp. DSM 44917]